MCGITGIIHFNNQPVEPATLQQMTDAIAHRGPDAEGIYVNGSVGLGNRRLSIIDLSEEGNQPIFSSDKRHVIVYNGELYNFKALHAELSKLGHQFNTKTDTEVILNSYIQWGRDCLEKFNGMFAFAIYDTRDKTIFIARDRYGIKPLYYNLTGNRLAFGSEVKTILQHPDSKTELNHSGLLEYFTFQNFFTPQTLFKNIQLLPAGYYFYLDLNSDTSTTVKATPYWDFNFEQPKSPLKDEDYIEELSRLFEQAVKRQLVSDVNLGSYLSSGMDSGSVTAVANSNLERLNTFTIGFNTSGASEVEQQFDESKQARKLAHLLGSTHFENILDKDAMNDVVGDLIWHLEEPRMGQSYQNYHAAQLAGSHNKVVLSGAGGDELFAGYPWRYYRAIVNRDFNHYQQKYFNFWQRLLNDAEKTSVFKGTAINPDAFNAFETFKQVFPESASHNTRPEDYLNHCLYFEAKTFLHGLLVLEDKLSMAHSLEARVPFLDNDLVDFAVKLPAHLKLGKLSEVVALNEPEPGKKHRFITTMPQTEN